jgi:hypothetical protein
MGKKAKHCWALSANFSVQLIVFLDHVLLLAEWAKKFKFLQNSCRPKQFHETELQGIYLYCIHAAIVDRVGQKSSKNMQT